MNQHIIGLIGAKGAGKDTAASHLIASRDYVRVAFADKLYREVAQTFDVSLDFLGNRDTKETDLPQLSLQYCSDPAFVQCVAEEQQTAVSSEFLKQPRSPRYIMQLWGTEYRRKRGVDSYWLDQVAAVLDASPDKSFVITDVRFPNEAIFVHDRSGVLLRIRRPELEAREAANRAANGTSAHESETAMLSYPVEAEVLNPEGAPQSLFLNLETALAELTTA